MNKIPKCNNKKIKTLKISKKTNKDSICNKMKKKILSNKSIICTFGKNIMKISKPNGDNKLTKKSSSYNDKVS